MGFAVRAFCGSFQSICTGNTRPCELEKVVLDILKTFKLSYSSVPKQGTGHIPKHKTKELRQRRCSPEIFSLVFLHLFLLCPWLQWIWNFSHSLQRITWPAMLQHAKPPNPLRQQCPSPVHSAQEWNSPAQTVSNRVCSLGETSYQPLDQQQMKHCTKDAFHQDSG